MYLCNQPNTELSIPTIANLYLVLLIKEFE